MSRFIRFGIVGAAGFMVDTTVLYVLLYLFDMGFYFSRLCSFFVSVTFTWYCNRVYTFSDLASLKSKHYEWGRFVLTNSIGGMANYGTYSFLIHSTELVRSYPVLGVAAGSIAGLIFNFTLSKHFVFRSSNN